MSDRWSEFSRQIDQAIPAQAPGAGRPGMGQGNIPNAPGIMSGRLPGATPEARQMYSGVQGSMPAPPPTGPAGAAPGPAGPAAPGMGMPPAAQAQVLDYLMKVMMQRSQQGQRSPISSAGTF